jgi:hypothetical protein
MNRHEQRVLRDIERSLTVEDPSLAELFGSAELGSRSVRLMRRILTVLAVPFLLLGLVLGDGWVLLTAGLLAGGAVLIVASEIQREELDR